MRLRSWFAAVLWLLLAASLAQAGDEGTPGAPQAALQAAVQEVAAGNTASALEALLALERQPLPASLKRQVDFLLGILLFRQGRREEAVPRLERAARDYPLLADYALYVLAQAFRKGGQRAEAAAALRQLLTDHPQSLFLERASRELPRDYLEAGDLAKAEEAGRQYLGAFPSGPRWAEAWLAIGEALLRSGRTQDAEDVFRRVWIEFPGNPESARAKDLLGSIPAARPFTPDEQFQRASIVHQLGRFGQAVQELTPFAAAGSPREAQARLLLGISAFNLRQYGQAVQWLDPLKEVSGASHAEALYWLGRSAGRSGDSVRMIETLTFLADTARETRRGEEALFLLAQAAADDGDVTRAQVYLARLLAEYPRGAFADAALWLQGWLAYKQQEMPTALAAWGRLLTEELGSRYRVPALYWRGRAFEAMRQPADAVQAFRAILDSAPDQPYYRLRATERLAALARKTPVPGPALAPRVGKSDLGSGLHAQKARALRGLGLVDETVEEYSEQVRSRPDDRAGLGESCRAFLGLQRYDKAVWLGRGILRPLFLQEGGRSPIPEFWQCWYPLGHLDLVRQHAKTRGLDPYLVLALIREESAFAPHAVSRTGARGLMQLMPQTADLVARENNLPPASAAALEAPEVNIRLGVIHLADLLREIGGTLSLALASYNAGKPPVQRWVQRFGFADEAEFIEDIPYAETRNYVKRVLGSYDQYTHLYATPPTVSSPPVGGRAVPGRPRTEGRTGGAWQ